MKNSLGKMLYDINDSVEVCYKGNIYQGYILIRDYGGGGRNFGTNHSYDVMLQNFNNSDFLLKHIPEKDIKLITKKI